MNGAQITVIILMSLKAIMVAALHGQPKTGTWNGMIEWCSIAIWLAILAWGGFWK